MNRLGLNLKNQTFLINNIRSVINNGEVIHECRRYNHVFTFKEKRLMRCFNRNIKINNVTFKRLASTALYNSNEFMSETLNDSNEISEFAVDVLPRITEPSFSELGLGGESTWGLLQYGLEYLHVDCGLPWWGAVAVATFSLRVLVLPIVIAGRKNAVRQMAMAGKIQEINKKISLANYQGDVYQSRLHSQELDRLLKDNNISFFKNLLPPLIQGGIFYSFFKALNGMIAAPVQSLHTGGMLWFKDLTMPDPYCILPIYAGVSLFVMLEFGMEAFKIQPMINPYARIFFRIIPLSVIAITWNFNTLMLCFWVSNTMFSFLQLWIMKSKTVGKFLGTTNPHYSKENPPF